MSIFGGGNAASKDAAKARALQQVSNDRAMSQTQAEEQRAAPSRKVPRGRRLFQTTSATVLPDTFGGGVSS